MITGQGPDVTPQASSIGVDDLFGADHKSSNAFIANILLGIPVSAAVSLTIMPQALKSWEARLGDLSYGIYLNHFLVAGLLLWLAEAIGGEPFGRWPCQLW